MAWLKKEGGYITHARIRHRRIDYELPWKEGSDPPRDADGVIDWMNYDWPPLRVPTVPQLGFRFDVKWMHGLSPERPRAARGAPGAAFDQYVDARKMAKEAASAVYGRGDGRGGAAADAYDVARPWAHLGDLVVVDKDRAEEEEGEEEVGGAALSPRMAASPLHLVPGSPTAASQPPWAPALPWSPRTAASFPLGYDPSSPHHVHVAEAARPSPPPPSPHSPRGVTASRSHPRSPRATKHAVSPRPATRATLPSRGYGSPSHRERHTPFTIAVRFGFKEDHVEPEPEPYPELGGGGTGGRGGSDWCSPSVPSLETSTINYS